MELILVVVGAIVLTAVAQRRGLQPALVIVVVGLAVSFTPGFPGIELGSRVLLSVVVPPLLYSAALDFSFPTFLRNIRPILGLGVGLIAITALAVAGVASWVVPTMGFATAVMLGAVVAPPDAVSAVAVGRKLGMPRRVTAILKGESLVNDAAALALFTVALTHAAGDRPFIGNPLLLFGYGAVIGPLIGVALGYTTLWIRRRLAHPGLETIQGLVVPYAAYLCADRVHASAVLAVVAAGFVVGQGSLRAGYLTRLQERYVWNSVDVLLEAFVFAYIGLQLRFVVQDMRAAHDSPKQVVAVSAAVLLTVLVVRPVWVFLMFRSGPRSADGESKTSRVLPAWGRPLPRGALTWREKVMVSWTGMRGVVTLAAASAIPQHNIAGEHFAHRSTSQVVAFVVTVGTLLLQGSTLPLLIRRLRPGYERETTDAAAATAKAEQLAGDVAVEVLDQFEHDPPPDLDTAAVTDIRRTIAGRVHDADTTPSPDLDAKHAALASSLYRQVLASQRVALITQRDAGTLDDEIVRAMLERLDLEEAAVTARLNSRF